MNKSIISAAAILIAGLILGMGCGPRGRAIGSDLPTTPILFTECAHITDLALARDGSLWASTKGGLIQWKPGDNSPQLWTTAQGLLSNDLRKVTITSDGAVTAGTSCLCGIAPDGKISDMGKEIKGREIHCLSNDGSLIGTSGGLYKRSNGKMDRLLNGRISGIASEGSSIWVIADNALVDLVTNRHYPLPEDTSGVTGFVALGKQIYLASALGLCRFENGRWAEIPFPTGSPASHVSALTAGDGLIYAALYGDGLYSLEGDHWTRITTAPDSLRHTTALLYTPKGLIAGTQSDGVWNQSGSTWNQRELPPSLPSADIYSVACYGGTVLASTFDHGLLRFEHGKWVQLTREDGLSTGSPRDLIEYAGALYIRHTTGELDRYDGKTITRAFAKSDLPREVYSIATDGKRLYMGSWAGWVATDGQTFEQHFKEPELQGQVITAIASDGSKLWLGTQKAGLFCYSGGRFTQYHESQGLTDDWITCIATRNNRVLTGTYTGGLLELKDDKFKPLTDAGGFAVRAIAFLPDSNQAITATSLGVYKEKGTQWKLLDPAKYGGLESQALCTTPKGLWVGTRTSLAYTPH